MNAHASLGKFQTMRKMSTNADPRACAVRECALRIVELGIKVTETYTSAEVGQSRVLLVKVGNHVVEVLKINDHATILTYIFVSPSFE